MISERDRVQILTLVNKEMAHHKEGTFAHLAVGSIRAAIEDLPEPPPDDLPGAHIEGLEAGVRVMFGRDVPLDETWEWRPIDQPVWNRFTPWALIEDRILLARPIQSPMVTVTLPLVLAEAMVNNTYVRLTPESASAIRASIKEVGK